MKCDDDEDVVMIVEMMPNLPRIFVLSRINAPHACSPFRSRPEVRFLRNTVSLDL
jgi:hypothetical protein